MQANDKDIDCILMRRTAPPNAGGGLAERIIHAALTQTQTQMQVLGKPPAKLWDDFISMFVMPNPSVAVAAGVLLGIALGLHAGDGLTVLQQDWSSFLYVNEGGWL